MQIYLYMGARESRCTQSLLSFVKQFAFWYTQYEGCLITSSSHRSNSVTILPSSMNSFTWIQKVKLHNLASPNEMQEFQQYRLKEFIHDQNQSYKRLIYLIRISSIPGHNNTPATASSSHGGNMESFFPFLVNPFERKCFTHFVGLLCVRSSCRARIIP